MNVQQNVQQMVAEAMRSRAETLESLLVLAIGYQRYDMLDRLTIVEQDGCCGPAVASRLDQ